MKKIRSFFILFLILFCLLSCKKEENKKNIILSTIDPITHFIEKVCGDGYNVLTIVPTGSSPETYEPKIKDMIKYKNAIIYFSIGLNVEDDSVYKYISDDTKEVELDKLVCEVYPDLYLGDERDPHIWLSIKRAILMVEIIKDEFSNLFPINKELFESNANKFINELTELDLYIKNLFEGSNSSFITFHPAFQYFSEEYSINMYALEEEGKESAPKDRIKIIELSKELNLKVIFYQEELSSKEAKSIASEIGGVAKVLSPLSINYIENMKYIADAIKGAQNGHVD